MKNLVLAFLLISPAAWAETPMPDVPVGLHHTGAGDCTDNKTHESGQCVLEADEAGNTYVVFRQDGVIQFIRQTFPDAPYVDLWVRDTFATY